MKKWIKRIVMILLLLVFLGAGTRVFLAKRQYRISSQRYEETAEEFTRPSTLSGAGQTATVIPALPEEPSATPDPLFDDGELIRPVEYAPIVVDFEALQEINPDIIGWIYCEDTCINYPVLHGKDNDEYLEHTYRHISDPAGCIFTDASNHKNFNDYNIIFYGHHMQDMTMFATLKYWFEREGYYEEHPVMWLLTPEQDYQIVIFAGYVTSALSDTYTVFYEPGEELNAYLHAAVEQSQLQTDVKLRHDAHYVLLSTCAYSFEYARSVLHGMLVPVNSAAGEPLTEIQ